ncbi:MAG: response regulator [Deltaproteobacteria bacterium]|mgnify:CR=1 FL=1
MTIKKILIIDDSPIARKILRKCLPEGHDFELFEACNGQEGLEKFKELSPDVTFLDLTMPVMDGVTALEEIRKFNENAVVIVNTADIQIKSINKVLDRGALMVLRKPPTKETVEKALQSAEEELKNVR